MLGSRHIGNAADSKVPDSESWLSCPSNSWGPLPVDEIMTWGIGKLPPRPVGSPALGAGDFLWELGFWVLLFLTLDPEEEELRLLFIDDDS